MLVELHHPGLAVVELGQGLCGVSLEHSNTPLGSTSTQTSLVRTSPMPQPITSESGGTILRVPEGRKTPDTWEQQ